MLHAHPAPDFAPLDPVQQLTRQLSPGHGGQRGLITVIIIIISSSSSSSCSSSSTQMITSFWWRCEAAVG